MFHPCSTFVKYLLNYLLNEWSIISVRLMVFSNASTQKLYICLYICLYMIYVYTYISRLASLQGRQNTSETLLSITRKSNSGKVIRHLPAYIQNPVNGRFRPYLGSRKLGFWTSRHLKFCL